MSPRTALITGASSGIGAAIARLFAERGWKLALGARGAERLNEFADSVRADSPHVFATTLDVSKSDSVDRFFTASEAALGVADVIVNNAGGSLPGALHERSVDGLRCEVEINLLGPLWVARRALQGLFEREISRGDLVFISSDAATLPRPRQATYGATKAGIEQLARALALELEGTGIRSTIVRVGPTGGTDFGARWDAAGLPALLAYWQRFGLQRDLRSLLAPEDVARAVLCAVDRPAGVHFDLVEVQPRASLGEA